MKNMRYAVFVGNLGFPRLMIHRLVEALPPRTCVVADKSRNTHSPGFYAVQHAWRFRGKAGIFVSVEDFLLTNKIWRVFVLRCVDAKHRLPPCFGEIAESDKGFRVTYILDNREVTFDGTPIAMRERHPDRIEVDDDILNDFARLQAYFDNVHKARRVRLSKKKQSRYDLPTRMYGSFGVVDGPS